eukprot:6299012-Amphidinium_carterae.1
MEGNTRIYAALGITKPARSDSAVAAKHMLPSTRHSARSIRQTEVKASSDNTIATKLTPT